MLALAWLSTRRAKKYLVPLAVALAAVVALAAAYKLWPRRREGLDNNAKKKFLGRKTSLWARGNTKCIKAGYSLKSGDGKWHLEYQLDGNLAIWDTSNPSAPGFRWGLDSGNGVYAGLPKHAGGKLCLMQDGNVYIVDANGNEMFNADRDLLGGDLDQLRTAAGVQNQHGNFRLVMRRDGYAAVEFQGRQLFQLANPSW